MFIARSVTLQISTGAAATALSPAATWQAGMFAVEQGANARQKRASLKSTSCQILYEKRTCQDVCEKPHGSRTTRPLGGSPHVAARADL